LSEGKEGGGGGLRGHTPALKSNSLQSLSDPRLTGRSLEKQFGYFHFVYAFLTSCAHTTCEFSLHASVLRGNSLARVAYFRGVHKRELLIVKMHAKMFAQLGDGFLSANTLGVLSGAGTFELGLDTKCSGPIK
jgi:hypothetical protein